MEKIEKTRQFLAVDQFTAGDGSGSGYGYGDGYGSGLREYDGRKVYYIDGIATLIDQVCVSYARGSVVNGDLTLSACYIAREGNFFAHGDTLREAAEDAHQKWMEQRPLSDRIGDFVAQHPSLETICSFEDLFEWHHVLTGSCEYGRRKFATANGLKEGDTLTVAAFITLTRDAYGSDAIRQLEKAYKSN